MQEGSFRCDVNISIKPEDSKELGTRSEIKNLNSFRFVEKAINFEIQRHIATIESGDKVLQETRLFDVSSGETRSMRSKEQANDYRYFPDPDLLPVKLDAQLLDEVRATLPELPAARCQRLQSEYGLNSALVEQLVADKELANYFELCVSKTKIDAVQVANWVNGNLTAALNKNTLSAEQSQVSAIELAQLLDLVNDNTISGKIAKQVFEKMWQGEGNAREIVESDNLAQISNPNELENIVVGIIAASPQQVEQYRAGKEKILGYFVGQVMQATQGKADPQVVNELIKQKLS